MSTNRDIRQARRESLKRELEPYELLLAPLDSANDDDPQGDQAWTDAIAEANSGTAEMNRSDE